VEEPATAVTSVGLLALWVGLDVFWQRRRPRSVSPAPAAGKDVMSGTGACTTEQSGTVGIERDGGRASTDSARRTALGPVRGAGPVASGMPFTCRGQAALDDER
jgi:hypothetical protein